MSVWWSQNLNSGSFIPEPYFAIILRASDYKKMKMWFLLPGNSGVKAEIHTDKLLHVRLSVLLGVKQVDTCVVVADSNGRCRRNAGKKGCSGPGLGGLTAGLEWWQKPRQTLEDWLVRKQWQRACEAAGT